MTASELIRNLRKLKFKLSEEKSKPKEKNSKNGIFRDDNKIKELQQEIQDITDALKNDSI